MSIIIGFVTDNCGVVASDSRLTAGAKFDNGIVIKKSSPISDAFDKTFSLNDGKIIGAVAGTMKFNEKTIAVHLEEILVNESSQNDSLEEVIVCLKNNLKERMEHILNEEILFKFRAIDLILIASYSGNVKDLKIYNFRFKPDIDNSFILIEEEVISPEIANHAYWKTFGDDTAQNVINAFIKTEIYKLKKVNERFLRSLAYKAIRLGIKNSTKNQYGDDFTCGGKPFVKSIK